MSEDLEVKTNRSPSPPLVTAIIPTRNRPLLLERALNSVFNQTHQNLEIIVVDDASTDGTKDFVTALANPAVRYIRHETNKGGSAARNTGIRAASGDYIAFLDDDDEWEPDKTKEQLKMLQDYDVVLCTSNEHRSGAAKFEDGMEVTLGDLRKGRFTAGGTGVLMAKAAAMREILFDEDLPRCQDWDVFIRLALKYKVGYLNRPLVKYNEGDHTRISNEILNLPAKEQMKKFRFLDKHKSFFGPRLFRWHMSRFLLYGLRHRTDKWQHLLFAVRECGLIAVTQALSRRVYQRLSGSI